MRYEEFIRRNESALRTYARKFAGNPEDAQDLYQDTVIKIFSHFDSWDKNRDPTNWCLQIMKRTHLDIVRKRGRRIATTQWVFDDTSCATQFIDHHPLPDEVAMFRVELEARLDTLPDRRRTIADGIVNGKDARAISQELHTSEGAIRSQLCKIRKTPFDEG